jgi:hypothetical protein
MMLGVANTVADLLSSIERHQEFDHDIWIGGSGAFCP